MKSQWVSQGIATLGIIAATILLLWSQRVDLLLIVAPISLLTGWLSARARISGQRKM
jgi:hypothetical protein